MKEDLEIRYQRARQRVWNQKTQLRSLNRTIRLDRLHDLEKWRHYQQQVEFLKNELALERKRTRFTDYRSVCRCWPCRLRRWWQFRSGKTYPGTPGWRFPWASTSR